MERTRSRCSPAKENATRNFSGMVRADISSEGAVKDAPNKNNSYRLREKMSTIFAINGGGGITLGSCIDSNPVGRLAHVGRADKSPSRTRDALLFSVAKA